MKRLVAALSLVLLFSGGFILIQFEASGRGLPILPERPVLARFALDPTQSKFAVKTGRGGLAWFKGHEHHVAVTDFDGQVELAVDALNPASLRMTIRSAALEETSDVFTPEQKDIINQELDEIVLEAAKYPEITFRSTDVKGELKNGKFEVSVTGDITLHGVTKRITIPASVSVVENSLRAQGSFSLDRSDFNVKATSAFHGLVRVRNSLRFTFDIVGRRIQ